MFAKSDFQSMIVNTFVKSFYFLSKLPLPVLHWMGSAIGWAMYLGFSNYRSNLKRNIGRAGYQNQMYKVIRELGKNILELPFIWCAPPSKVMATASVENWEIAQAALDTGRGVIFLTAHIGGYEIIAQAIAARTPIAVLYRQPTHPALKSLMEKNRARHNLLLAPANLTGTRMLLKTLKKGGAIGLLPDQGPQRGNGVWANFFGKPVYTMTLPAKLHKMTGAVILLSYAERLPNGSGYSIRFAPFEQKLEGTQRQQAASINKSMEQLIGYCPAQYFWCHDRYRW